MANVFTKYAEVGSIMTPAYYADFVIANLYPSCYLRQLGTLVSIPLHHGTTVKIPRWKPGRTITALGQISSTSVSAITGGITEIDVFSKATKMTAMANITGQLKLFAGSYGYNDLIVVANRTDFFEGAYENLAHDLAIDLDQYTRQNLSAFTTVRVIDGTAAGANTTDVLRGKYVGQMGPVLDVFGAPRWDDDCFVALTNPLTQADIYNDISATGWVSINQYGNPSVVYKGEIGQMYGIRFLVSNIIPRIAATTFESSTLSGSLSASFGICSKATGTNTWVFSPDSFYTLEFEGSPLEVIHHELGSAGAADPTNNQGTVAVKLYYGIAPTLKADRRITRWGHGLGVDL